jgi:hypothetical protein
LISERTGVFFQKRIVFSGALVILLLIASLLPIYPSPQGATDLWTLLFQQGNPSPQDEGDRLKLPINATVKRLKEEKGQQKPVASQAAQTASADKDAAEVQPEKAPKKPQNASEADKKAEPEPQASAPSKQEQQREAEQSGAPSGFSQEEREKIRSFLSAFGQEHLEDRLIQAILTNEPLAFGERVPSRLAFFTASRLPRTKEISFAALDWEQLTGEEPKWAVLWKPTLKINKKFPNRSKRSEIRRLQQMLADLGHYNGRIDGLFGSGTLQAVESFQEKHDLPKTKGPDSRTVFWICVEHRRSE